MSQPAARRAAFRVRLIASMPICMALAVHTSSSGLVHFIRGHLDCCIQQQVVTCDPGQGQGQGHSDPDLTELQGVAPRNLGLWESPVDEGLHGQQGMTMVPSGYVLGR